MLFWIDVRDGEKLLLAAVLWNQLAAAASGKHLLPIMPTGPASDGGKNERKPQNAVAWFIWLIDALCECDSDSVNEEVFIFTPFCAAQQPASISISEYMCVCSSDSQSSWKAVVMRDGEALLLAR